MPHRHDFAESYWANVAGSLTVLSLRYSRPLDPAATSALCQLTRLQKLSLAGSASASHNPAAGGHIELSLPQLESLTKARFMHASVSLSCPRLQSLELESLRPLEALEGIPQGITRVWLKGLERVSLPLEDLFRGHRLEQFTSLGVLVRPGSYEDPADLEFIRQLFRGGRLEILRTDCPLEKLMAPLGGAVCPLSISLQSLTLDLPLERGIPVVLEQLTNLRSLVAIDTGAGPVHLDRPLDPFLDMTHLRALVLGGKAWGPPLTGQSHGWTPDALKFLGLASRRILDGSLMPGGRKVTLVYIDEWQELAKHRQALGMGWR